MKQENYISNASQFLAWEQISRDSIDVKRIYIDIADDLIAGILLSQIVYWYLPNQEGKTKLRVKKADELWLAKGRNDWRDECRITSRQFDKAIKTLEEKGLVTKKLFKFAGVPTIHVKLNIEKLTDCILTFKKLDEHSILHKRENPFYTKGEMGIDKSVKSFTETTPKSTSKSTKVKASSNDDVCVSFNHSIFDRQLKKVALQINYSEEDLISAKEVFDYFFDKYQEYYEGEHPKISNENLKNILNNMWEIETFNSTTNVDSEDYEGIIDEYFNNDYKFDEEKCGKKYAKHNLMHFFISYNIRTICYERIK